MEIMKRIKLKGGCLYHQKPSNWLRPEVSRIHCTIKRDVPERAEVRAVRERLNNGSLTKERLKNA